MLILHSIKDFKDRGCAVALGTFDGVHRGHALLIKKTRALAAGLNLPSAALTFDRHPLSLIRPDALPPMLTTNAEKERLLEALGLDILIEEPFTAEFAAQTPEEYIHLLCDALHPAAIVIGRNHTFGRRGRGDAALLQSLGSVLGFRAVVVEPLCLSGAPVSSTRIRTLLLSGRRREAEELAGHPLAGIPEI